MTFSVFLSSGASNCRRRLLGFFHFLQPAAGTRYILVSSLHCPFPSSRLFRQESVPSTNQSQNITLLNSSNHNLAHSIHNFAQSIYNFAQPTITLLIYPWPFWVTAICIPYFVIDKKGFAKLGKGDKVDMEVADNKEKEEVLIKVIKMVDEIILSSKWNHCIISSVSGSVRSWLTTDQWRWS